LRTPDVPAFVLQQRAVVVVVDKVDGKVVGPFTLCTFESASNFRSPIGGCRKDERGHGRGRGGVLVGRVLGGVEHRGRRRRRVFALPDEVNKDKFKSVS
jgi:hypothetical protein